jgi:acetyltransferase-like isoleucine patch superfamily enzyme
MPSLRRLVAVSDRPAARAARWLHRRLRDLTLPAPRIVVRPLLWAFLGARSCFYFGKRVLICEPLFKAYCTQYGRGLRTDVFIPWVQGRGDIILGDGVRIDGMCSIVFAARFADRPTLRIGDHTGIGHQCSFTVAQSVVIGKRCMIAAGSMILDSNGHPTDPAARLAGLPPSPEEVRPVEIGDNVWIGSRSIILPGVKIGDGSIVAANSVVRSVVRPYTVVAGNPARKIADLARPAGGATLPEGRKLRPPGEDEERSVADRFVR